MVWAKTQRSDQGVVSAEDQVRRALGVTQEAGQRQGKGRPGKGLWIRGGP